MKHVRRAVLGTSPEGARERARKCAVATTVVADLTFEVRTPAAHETVREPRARVRLAEGDLFDICEAADRHGPRSAGSTRDAVATRSVLVPSPTLHGAVV